jgi:hypothetical protein
MEKSKTGNMKKEGSETHGYAGKKACISLLLQAGVDIWQRHGNRDVPDPGFDAPHEARLWWYDKLQKKNIEQKPKSMQRGPQLLWLLLLLQALRSTGISLRSWVMIQI